MPQDEWVAVAPEHTNNTGNMSKKVKSASSAYQWYLRSSFQTTKHELQNSNLPHDVGSVTKEVSIRWSRKLTAEEKVPYEEMAHQDKMRFEQESALRDDEVAMEQARRRKENNNDSDIYLGSSQSQKQHRGASMAAREEYDRRATQAAERRKKTNNSTSAAVNVKRTLAQEQAQRERDEQDAYIERKRSQVRKERAKQAKRRLEYLLKQSNIFSNFGEVKEDESRLRVAPSRNKNTDNDNDNKQPSSVTVSSRREQATATTITTGTGQEDMDDEAENAEETEATFLTAQPSTIGFGKMRPYQLEGLNWMIRLQEHGVNGILADEMGLGKTLQSISVLVYMKEYFTDEEGGSGPHLIVVPKSTLSNWMNELKRWGPTLRAVRFHGNKEERERIANEVVLPGVRDENRDWDVIVTTYEVCNSEKNLFNKFAWSYLIIDEAHRLKNEASVFSKNIRQFETRYRLLLTGTPLQNNLHELWALLNFLVPDVFSSAEQFDEWFNLDTDDVDAKNNLISQLHKILRPFMLRRLKADVEKSLPPKHETILYTGMSAKQKKVYRDILLRDIDTLQGKAKGGNRTALLNIVMQLRKCAGHPYLFPGVEDRSLPPLGEHLVENSGKMVLLDKLLMRLKERGHRVLLFTQMTKILDILEDYLVMRQFKYCRIDGNTSYDVREESIDGFNAPDSDKFLFLLSTRAGGLGINLQTADIVILFDSDWNPQADLQAQDRAHRIGQKKPVQVFRFVTEHTIEEKIVERAQQKLKLDAMVVQQGRLKDAKAKLSSDEILKAVRFGADKIFKSTDSSITNDDIDLILDAGKKKTEAMNEKLKVAEKGDLLDFKLDVGENLQTFEGVDYSYAQSRSEILGILDLGKRERNVVANYNESVLYKQVADGGLPKPERKKKETRLPKFLRLPRMDEWQMFDRDTLNAIQLEEEKEYKRLADEGKLPTDLTKVEEFPPLLPEDRADKKRKLLAEGFADWARHHYVSFVKASATYGRRQHDAIANIVGKPSNSVKEYADAFWGEFGKSRMSEKEYERAITAIERGEKKLKEGKDMERGTAVLVSLFDNPWHELQLTHFNSKDKSFTAEEDRYLLCWCHKFGYGMWRAIRFAIRRSRAFRFNYHMRSLTEECIGRRCEQLMRAAMRDVEHMERAAREEAGMEADAEDSDGPVELEPVTLPKYSVMATQIRAKAEEEVETERKRLVANVENIETEMEKIQARLRELQRLTSGSDRRERVINGEVNDDLLPALVDLVARSGHTGINSIAKEFSSRHPVTMQKVKTKIDEVAVKEKREDEGDTKDVWHIKNGYIHMLDVSTLRQIRKEKEKRNKSKPLVRKRKHVEKIVESDQISQDEELEFPPYDGTEPPRDAKRDFTIFCIGTRRDIKSSLGPVDKKDKKLIHRLLKERWENISNDEKQYWKDKEAWEKRRYAREMKFFSKRNNIDSEEDDEKSNRDVLDSIPKKNVEVSGGLSIPKKKRMS